MAYVDRYDAALSVFVGRYLRNNVHTNIRGTVVGVNYAIPSVDVKPMAQTEFENGTVEAYPVIYDVPINFPSGAGGKARLSMPIKVGDLVGVAFSERNESDFKDVNTHQLFPGWAVTQIFTEGNGKAAHPDNVVLENDKGVMTLMPDGTMTFQNPAANLKIEQSGKMTFSNGPANIEVMESGMVRVNGCTITTSGNVITASGVDLEDFYADYLNHRHSGVERGGDISGVKV
ncbi:hypothetical protein A71_125 [Escherichia phage A7_1]|nr:hypothetical protein A71_125 [Escherichia phage A7_1]